MQMGSRATCVSPRIAGAIYSTARDEEISEEEEETFEGREVRENELKPNRSAEEETKREGVGSSPTPGTHRDDLGDPNTGKRHGLSHRSQEGDQQPRYSKRGRGEIGVKILTKRGSPFDVRKAEELGESSNDSATHAKRGPKLSPRIREAQTMQLKIAIPCMFQKPISKQAAMTQYSKRESAKKSSTARSSGDNAHISTLPIKSNRMHRLYCRDAILDGGRSRPAQAHHHEEPHWRQCSD